MMQAKQTKIFRIAALLSLASASGGLLLGHYATGGDTATVPGILSWPADSDTADASAAQGAALTMDAEGPEKYVCQGCGQSLADRRAQIYANDYTDDYSVDIGYAQDDLAPLPPYRPTSFDDDGAKDDVDAAQGRVGEQSR